MLVLRALYAAYLRLLSAVVHSGSLTAGHPKGMYVCSGQALSMQSSGFHNGHEHDDSDSDCSWEGPRRGAATVSRHFHTAVPYRGFLAYSVAHIQHRVSRPRSDAAAVHVD